MKKIISLVLCVAMLTCMVAVSSAETSLRVAWWGGQERHNQTIEALDAYGAANDIKMEYEGTIDLGFLGKDVEFILNSDCDFQGVTKTGTGYINGTLGTKLPILGELSIPVEGYQQYMDDGMLTYTRFNRSDWLRSKVVPAQTSAEDVQFDLDYKIVLGIMQKIGSGEIKAELAEETGRTRNELIGMLLDFALEHSEVAGERT